MASESDITPTPPSDVEHEDTEATSSPLPVRGRGRGSPRSRRGGKRGGRTTGGAGTRQSSTRTSGTGRGTRKRRRGHDANRAQEALHALESRKERIQAQVDSMDENSVREVLREVMEKYPRLIFDIVSGSSQQSGGYHPGPGTNIPGWCVCNRCREMPSDVEKVCCQRDPSHCISQTADFQVLILDDAVLAIARMYRQDILALPENEDLVKANRHTAYRQFILWQHGRLGAGVRMVMPSCCVWAIRDKFPDPFGQYKGFVPSRLG